MSTYFADFRDWLHNEDKADKTVQTYLTELEKFEAWYEQTEAQTFDIREVTTLLLQDYRAYLMNTLEQKPATVNKAIATMKVYFSWAYQEGIITYNPAAKVKMKRVQRNHVPKWLTVQEENRLFFSLETERNEFVQARDNAIVYLMRYAGLRVEEVAALMLSHIDLKQSNVYVVDGKGGKSRVVPMHSELKKALKTWLQHRELSEKAKHQESEFLFVSQRAGQITTRAIEFMLDKYLERCGLLERSVDGKKFQGQPTCHSLRHTFCKRLIDAGRPLTEVARLAGHESVQTTMLYVEPSDNDLRKAIQSI